MIFELQFYFNFLLSFFFSVSYSIYKDYKNYKDFPTKKIQGFTHNEILKTYKKVIPLVSVNLFISSLPSSIIFYKILPDNVLNVDNFSVLYSIINFFMLSFN